MSFTPEIYEFSIAGYDYVVEFNREALKEADSMGAITDEGMGAFKRTCVILYAGLKKHHPNITYNRVTKIVDAAIDEGYGLDGFSDIVDDFTLCYKAVFTPSTDNLTLVKKRGVEKKK